MGRGSSRSDSKSRSSSNEKGKKSKKQKKSRKQRQKRSYSSSSQQRMRKGKNRQGIREKERQRERGDERQRNRKKNRNRKYRNSKQRERDRSRSKEKRRSKSKQKESQKDKGRQKKESKTQNNKKQKSKSPSPPTDKKSLTEDQRQRKLAMRKVKARLLKLTDILDGDKSESDSSLSQAPQLPAVQSSQSVPPPIPQSLPPPPPIPISTPSNPIQSVLSLKPKLKKQSRWGKTTPSQSSNIHMQTYQQNLTKLSQQNQENNSKLLLQPEHSEDLKLSLSQDRSVEVDHFNQKNKELEVIDEEYIDPLDQYMMQIQGSAAAQIELPKNSGKRTITFEQVVTNQSSSVVQKIQQKHIDQVDEEKFRSLFLDAVQKIGQKQQQMQQNDSIKGQMIQNNEDQQSDFQHMEEQKEGQLDYFAKQRKLAQRKDLGSINHATVEYQEVKFNLYREAQEVKNINYRDVVKYRKEAGDIKVRGKQILNPVFNWYQCGLSDKILSVIQSRGYGKPFPIQAQTLPLIMSGRDAIGIAETGSGKTLSYLLPTLKHIMAQRPVQEGQGPIAIIMTPTRELARQVYLEAKAFVKSTTIKVLSVYGGLSVQTQLADFKKGAQLVVCTPGRMLDILTLNKGRITNLKRVTLIVIDQADRMFDLGFQPQITRIIQNSRPKKQIVLFSATFPKNVQNLARRILINPCQVIVGSRGQACTNVQQIIVALQQTSKFLKLLQILGQWNQKGSILIFVDKQNQVDYLFQQLLKYGYHSLTLHGAMDHDDRQFTIYDFKKGIKTIMIATSVCARGLDIKAICLVVNFKCPNHLEDYIHRIGRTGRAGTKGTAITFITPQQEQYSIDLLKALEMSEIRPPEELIKLSQTYLSKVKKGQARKIRNRNLMGSGFKFDEQQQQKVNQIKNALKKQLKSEGLVGNFDDSDEEDIEMKKKKEENIRGRSQQDRIAEALKNPEIKNKLVSQAVKAVTEAMKSDNKLSTEKILEIAIGSMKESVTKHKVVTSVEDGVQKVTQLINQFQNKGIEGADFFSYDFQINDYPLNARQKACNQSFLKEVQHQTNCSVSLRGMYVQPGKKVPIGCRKLYLHIQGENKYYVTTAYKQIKGVLEENAYQSMHGGMLPGKYTI